ncbi:MAG: methionine ABC transporter substrate-binding protein, partial [Phascolarctobacterium sp.]|nr:methionine ABC transporter substrate-binding protein [Phascolarctobacterium sp.]
MKKLFIAALALLAIAMVAVGCGGDKKAEKAAALKVGATPVPHAEILNFIKPNLEKQGVKMEVIEFSDYVKPNLSLNDKEIDANFFQHDPYLAIFVNDRKLPLASAGKVHIEPMGVYSKTIKDIKAVPDGAKIAIPNDPSNGGRALAIPESAKLFTLKQGVGVNATVADIVDNPK